jgi:hypothetical protein
MAEVKVKITAANQTQTGFQSVLADAKKTATQVQQTFSQASAGPRMPKLKEMASAGPMDIDIGDYGLGPLRELQEELKKTRQAAQQALDPQPAEEFSGGIAQSAGRMALLGVGAAVVGKAISAAFDQLSQALKSAIGIQEQFNQTLSQAGRATSLSGAISEFTQLSNAAKQTGKVIADTFGRNIGEAIANALQGRPAQIISRLADLTTGGAVRGELEAGQEQQQRIARETTMANMARLDLESFELVGAGGDPAEVARIKREQEKRRQIEDLRSGLAGSPAAFIEQQVSELQGIQAMQDQMTAQERAFAAQQRAAQTERATAQIGMTPQEKLAQEQANQARLQGEMASAGQGAQPTEGADFRTAMQEVAAKVAARVAELNAEIAASKQIQAQLEKQIADEAERAAKATAAAQRSAMASAQSQAQANRVATMTPQEQLDFEMQGLADLQGFVGPEVEAQKQAAIGRIMALQSQIQNQGQGAMVGSFGASALQRIGFASNEFFDTRRREDPEKETKRAADAAKEILKILQGGEPLVLPASN